MVVMVKQKPNTQKSQKYPEVEKTDAEGGSKEKRGLSGVDAHRMSY